MLVRLNKTTIINLEKLANKLDSSNEIPFRHLYHRHRHRYWHVGFENEMIDLEELREWIIQLESIAKNHQFEKNDDFINEQNNWLVCEEDIKIIPLYKEAISVSALRYIIEEDKIPYLLKFINIPTAKTGLDIENHNFGYHFHYGKIKSGRLNRSNILLTFDPNNTEDDENNDNPPLYSEYHGEGKCQVPIGHKPFF